MAPRMSERDSASLAAQRGANLPRLVEIMRRLLAPGGCPWDQAQTPESLRRYVLEEACEVIDAIDRGDPEGLCEELGDLLLQVVFQAEIARGADRFGPDDVIDGICEKLERRHPHVFGELQVDNAEQVHRNWERIKAEEKRGRGVLDGVPKSLPALARAQRLGEKAARVGFDWPNRSGVRDKVDEELRELDEGRSKLASRTPSAKNSVTPSLLWSTSLDTWMWTPSSPCSKCRASSPDVSRPSKHKWKQEHGGFEEAREALDIETLESYWQCAKAQGSEAP